MGKLKLQEVHSMAASEPINFLRASYSQSRFGYEWEISWNDFTGVMAYNLII